MSEYKRRQPNPLNQKVKYKKLKIKRNGRRYLIHPSNHFFNNLYQPLNKIFIFPKSKRLVTSSKGTIMFWDMDTKSLLHTLRISTVSEVFVNVIKWNEDSLLLLQKRKMSESSIDDTDDTDETRFSIQNISVVNPITNENDFVVSRLPISKDMDKGWDFFVSFRMHKLDEDLFLIFCVINKRVDGDPEFRILTVSLSKKRILRNHFCQNKEVSSDLVLSKKIPSSAYVVLVVDLYSDYKLNGTFIEYLNLDNLQDNLQQIKNSSIKINHSFHRIVLDTYLDQSRKEIIVACVEYDSIIFIDSETKNSLRKFRLQSHPETFHFLGNQVLIIGYLNGKFQFIDLPGFQKISRASNINFHSNNSQSLVSFCTHEIIISSKNDVENISNNNVVLLFVGASNGYISFGYIYNLPFSIREYHRKYGLEKRKNNQSKNDLKERIEFLSKELLNQKENENHIIFSVKLINFEIRIFRTSLFL